MPLFPGEQEYKVVKERQTSALPGFTTLTAAEKQEQSRYERKRRQKEIILASLLFVVMLILVYIQLEYFGSSSLIFLVMFNFNLLLLVTVLFIVLRNGLKLVLERKRRVIGSRLRTRLVLAISTMTLLPCLVMFLVTAQFVKLSVDFWFKNQVETTIETALNVARQNYDQSGKRLKSYAEQIITAMQAEDSVENYSQLFAQRRQEYNLALVGQLSAELHESHWQSSSSIGNSWQQIKEETDWQQIAPKKFSFYLGNGVVSDFVFGIHTLPPRVVSTPPAHAESMADNFPGEHPGEPTGDLSGNTSGNTSGGQPDERLGSGQTGSVLAGGYLVVGESMGRNFKSNLEIISKGADEYRQLRNLKSPLKGMLYITLMVLTLLIVLGTIWFSFRITREITSPIMALVDATGKVAKGDTNIKLEDTSSDELGILITAFNRMAEEIGTNRRELTDTNSLLAQQNLVLDQQRRYVETVIENIAAGVISLDANGFVTTVNKAACEILKMDAKELLGKSLVSLMPQESRQQIRDIAGKLFKNPNTVSQMHYTLAIGEEEHRLLVHAVGLAAVGGPLQGTVAVFEDITEMEKMQRMAAWREVARRIAHEIKNPLTPIKLSAQRIEKKFATEITDPAFTQSTQLIVRQVEQLQAMVQEFSAFAKLPEITPRRGRLEPILTDAVQMFRDSHTNISWHIQIEDGLPELEIDSLAMQRVFMNILTNAAEALEKQVNASVNIRAVYNKKLRQIRVDVEDNGPDLLSNEERARLFEPYFSRKKGGTGLGLAIVKSIVAEHRGYVRASRLEDGGTTVIVELPVI